jgi:hypothetical protein
MIDYVVITLQNTLSTYDGIILTYERISIKVMFMKKIMQEARYCIKVGIKI